MSTTYCRLVNGNTVYAAITDADAAGNNIVNTYATKTELQAVESVPDVTASDDGKILKASYAGSTGSYAWATVAIPVIGTITLNDPEDNQNNGGDDNPDAPPASGDNFD